MEWKDRDLERLRDAVELLEHPGFVARLADVVGTPIDAVFDLLPDGASDTISTAVQKSLLAATNMAVLTMKPGQRGRPWFKAHMAAVGLTGGVGGAFGLAALPVELPITTTIIMRSIADIARGEGENLADVQARLACLEVFAMGGSSSGDDAAESGYLAVRTALARAVTDAAQYLVERTAVEEGAPVIVRLLASIAARFNIIVGEKVFAQAVPVLGGLGGATVNVLFIDHFQDMARGHFAVRALERTYGREEVEQRYRAILGE